MRGIAETDILDPVSEFRSFLKGFNVVGFANQITDSTFIQNLVRELHGFRQNIVEDRPTNRRIQNTNLRVLKPIVILIKTSLGAQLDGSVNLYLVQLIRHQHFVNVTKDTHVA